MPTERPPDPPPLSAVRAADWSGAIPMHLSLATESLSSTTRPMPVSLMVPRASYLHVALREEILRLHAFAPAASAMLTAGGGGGVVRRSAPSDDDEGDRGSEGNHVSEGGEQRIPVCWFEDEETGLALRWHLFAGVLYDIGRGYHRPQKMPLPWRVRVHFTSYPTSQILSFDSAAGVAATVERQYKNSLKQALFLEHGSARVANGLSRAGHRRLWDAVSATNSALYNDVNADLQADGMGGDGGSSSADGGGDGGGAGSGPRNVPVRVILDGGLPMQRACPPHWGGGAGEGGMRPTALGDLLVDWLPDLFERRTEAGESVAGPIHPAIAWTIQGLDGVPLDFPVGGIWLAACHPDHFLYVIVTSTKGLK